MAYKTGVAMTSRENAIQRLTDAIDRLRLRRGEVAALRSITALAAVVGTIEEMKKGSIQILVKDSIIGAQLQVIDYREI
jgi:hypothetical protein